MGQYYIYRLEHGLSVAEQRAADQRMGELAAALADVRAGVGLSLGRGLGALRALGRAGRASEQVHGILEVRPFWPLQEP